jgi:hypothetical protein
MKPYGYVRKDGQGLFIYGEDKFSNTFDHDLVPVYTHPKEWVGLTDDDWDEIFGNALTIGEAIKATEAKLKEKNT